MIKIMLMLKKKPGTTRTQFREYYESRHAEFVKQHIGHLLVRYVRNYPSFTCYFRDDSPEPEPFDFEYDGITEMHVKDDATFKEIQKILMSPEVHALLAEDEAKFIDRHTIMFLMCEEADTSTRPRA